MKLIFIIPIIWTADIYSTIIHSSEIKSKAEAEASYKSPKSFVINPAC
jgi:hypothetical protein